jgi:hypothetical protein
VFYLSRKKNTIYNEINPEIKYIRCYLNESEIQICHSSYGKDHIIFKAIIQSIIVALTL